MALTKRVTKGRLWIFGTAVLLGTLLAYLEFLGVSTGHGGDMICGGSKVCVGEFWIDVPAKLSNGANITALCFGNNLKVVLTSPEKMNGLGLYKADKRYRSDNPARWKKFNFTGNCLNVGNNSFMINATKDQRTTVKWAIEGAGIDPLWIGSTNSTNSTFAGTAIEHRLNWTNSALSGYIFSFCNGSFSNTTASQTTLSFVPSTPSILDNVTNGTLGDTLFPSAINFGSTINAAGYTALNASGGTWAKSGGTTSLNGAILWNVTLPVSSGINWINVTATLNSTTDNRTMLLWNFTSSTYRTIGGASAEATMTNYSFNITGVNVSNFTSNGRMYLLIWAGGTSTGSVGIDLLTYTINYNVSTVNNYTCDGTSGSLTNDTWTAFGGTWSNITKVVNSTVGSTIKWSVYANDSSNIWNTSVVFAYNTTNLSAVFIKQTPSDIDTYNILASNLLNITYNITSSGDNSIGIDSTKSKIWFKTNRTTDDISRYINGTSTTGYRSSTRYTNISSNYYFNLSDNDVYPATYNLDTGFFTNTSHSAYSIDNILEYVKLEFYNISNAKQYGFFEFMANNSSIMSNTLMVMYCNSSYTTGDTMMSSNCAEIGSLAPGIAYNHSHGGNSSHQVITFAINITTNTINNIKVTGVSYFILHELSPVGGWNVWYVPTVARTSAMQTTITGGVSWSDFSGTFDSHVHQYDGTDTFYYYVCGNDTFGNSNCSSIRNDLVNLTGLAPDAVDISSPTSQTYTGNLWINFTNSTSPNGYNITSYNISLVYPNTTFIASLTNTTANVGYNWNSTSYNGGYRIRVQTNDNISQYSYSYSENFTLDNYPKWSLNQTNTTIAGQPTLFSLNWSDETGLSGYIFSFCNGTWNGTHCYKEGTTTTVQLQIADTENLEDTTIVQNVPESTMGGNKVFAYMGGASSGTNDSNSWDVQNNVSGIVMQLDQTETTDYAQKLTQLDFGIDNCLSSTGITGKIWTGASSPTTVVCTSINGTLPCSGYVRSYFDCNLSESVVYWMGFTSDTNVTISRDTTSAFGVLRLNRTGSWESFTSTYANMKYWLRAVNQSSLVKFNITAVPDTASIINSTFCMYRGSPGGNIFFNIYNATSEVWNEEGTNYSNAPVNDMLINGTMTAINSWTCFNVTSAIQTKLSGNNITFHIENISSALQTYFYTKEYPSDITKRPYLNITYYTNPSWDIILVNDTFISMTGLTNWSNTTKTINSTIGANIAWRVYANDSSNNWNTSIIYTITTTNNTAPQYSNPTINGSYANQATNFTLDWTDDVNLSGYIFGTNNTGTWRNSSFSAFAGGMNTSWNVSVLNDTVGLTVSWSVYANDSSNIWNTSTIYNLTTSSSSSCDCSSIQAGTAINCAEGCAIGACNVGGIAVTFINTGTITTSGSVTNILRTTWSPGCTVVLGAGKSWG
jgi:hypothetical protein